MLSGLFLISVSSALVWFGTRMPQKIMKKESMSMEDAKFFPILGSAVLLGLFVALKYLSKALVNTIFRGIFSITGTVSLYKVFKMVHEYFTDHQKIQNQQKIKSEIDNKPQEEAIEKESATKTTSEKEEVKEEKKENEKETSSGGSFLGLDSIVKDLKEGFYEIKECVGSHMQEIRYPPYGMLFALSAAVNGWYFKTKGVISSNILGCAFSIIGIQEIRADSTKTVLVLLSLLFFYDIFWVFCTPVMMGVAKGLDIPIKIVYPFSKEGGGSMIGLGDIVIPGIFLALAREFAYKNNAPFIFTGGYIGYILALIITFSIVIIFKSGQPALLYICPLIVLGSIAGAQIHGKFKKFIDYKTE